MKNSAAIVALAAGLGQVAATGVGFSSAAKFNCPANTDNTCIDKQQSGFDWSDLATGSFSNYGGFNWNGFTCEDKFSKRNELLPRTFQNKCVTGNAKSSKSSSPSFGCDSSQGVEKTSIDSFQVTPEFDCDLEFHYDMPDGSTCKHRSACKASGTVVQNTQCGGAKNVTIVYPSQSSMPKETCSFGFHSISFDCNTASSTVSSKTSSVSATSSVVTTTSSVAADTTTSSILSTPTSTSTSSTPSTSTSTSTSSTLSTPTSTSTSYAVVSTSTSFPVANTSSTPAVESTTSTSSHAVETPSSSAQSPVSTVSTASQESTTTTPSPAVEVTPSPSTYVTSFLSTSTVYSTVVSTVTSCAATVTDCPAHSTVLTTVTVAVSTTICPVTETHTSAVTPTTKAVSTPAAVSTSSTSPAAPVETLPCPDVVPSCLNTWMFSVGCKDNTDASCYCPDASFVDNVYSCLYSYGASDDVVAEAISYFKGICAPYVSQNPAIATGDYSITTVLTATATAPASAVYTTILVTATTVVPCTQDDGEIITGSSSTVTISTAMTVPQIAFTTVSSGAAIVPATYTATPVASTPVASTPVATGTSQAAVGVSSAVSTLTKATGTISYKATPTPTGSPIATAGASRQIGSGLGLLGFAIAAIVAF